MTAAAASPHVARATKRLIAKGWLREDETDPCLTPLGHRWKDGHMVERTLVRSEQDGHEPYVVTEMLATGEMRCECQDVPGRKHSTTCKHCELLREKQNRIGNSIRGVEAQLALEAVYR